MPPISEAQGGGGASGTVLLAVGGLLGHAGDHRPVDAQIGQLTGGQGLQFAQGLPIDPTASEGFGEPRKEAGKTGLNAADILDECHCGCLELVMFCDVLSLFGLTWPLCCDCTMGRAGNAAMQKVHAVPASF